MPAGSFSTVQGTASAPKTFTVSGSNLTGDLTVGPLAGYELSSDGFATVGAASLTLTASGGTVASTTVSVRLAAATATGAYNSNIDIAGGGATTQSVAVAGTVLAAEPTAQPTVSVANISPTQADITVSGGNGSGQLVVVRAAATAAVAPTDGAAYVGSLAVGSGATTGTGNYVVFVGATGTTTFTVTSLAGLTSYAVETYAYNGTSATANYLATSPGTASFTTPAAPLPIYIWTGSGANANWTTAANWSPARTSPAATDIMVFDGTVVNPAVTIDFTSQTVAQLQFSGNANVTFSNSGNTTRTLTINDGNAAGADFGIVAGARLNVISSTIGANGFIMQLASGASGSIGGSLVFDKGGQRLQTTVATSSIEFLSGSSYKSGVDMAGSPFGTLSANYNTVTFRNGSTVEQAGGSQVFGATAPNSAVVLEPTSLYTYSVSGSSTPPLSNRTYGSLEFNVGSGNASSTANGTLTIAGNLAVTSGTISLNLDNTISIGGNLTIDAGTLSFNPGSARTLVLNGTALQTIGGSAPASALTFGTNSSLQVNNAAGVSLQRAINLQRILTLTSGTLALNGQTLTLNGALAVAGGRLEGSATAGLVLTGAGTLATLATTAGAGSTFGSLTLNRTDTGTLTFGNSVTLNSLTLSKGVLAIGPVTTLTLNGPVVAATTGSLLGSATSGLIFTGASPVTGSLVFSAGAGSQLQTLTLNQTTNSLIPVASTLTIGTLNLTVGSLLFSGAGKAIVTTLSGGSAASFVNALSLPTAASTTPAAIIYPLGAQSYLPLTFAPTQTAATATNYTARVAVDNANNRGVTAPLTRVSARHFFTLSEDGTANYANAGTLTLSFANEGATDPATLRIASSTAAGPWTDVNPSSTPTVSGTPSGTITETVMALTDFALATTSTDLTINPLPVELVRFTAQRQASTVALSWATASEKNSVRFEVQRSPNGREYVIVATAVAQGSSTQATAYAALDKAAPAGRLYYRLRQVDLDGTAAFSPVVLIAELGETTNMQLYPNPAHSYLSFIAEGAMSYRVLNQLGQPLLRGTTAAGTTTLAIPTLPTGIYFLELQTASGRTVQKFEKE
ncbi:MAG: T9SS type A sorting domain-containing protein [Bacteroidota bacterium]|nr:T9SS type A sorting domain-containing protein [Bacteroidota bacterium]